MRLLFFSVLHPPSCREGVVAAALLRRRLDLPLARDPWSSRKSQAPKAEVLDGVVVGEVVEAEVDALVEQLRRHLLLLLRQVVMPETQC